MDVEARDGVHYLGPGDEDGNVAIQNLQVGGEALEVAFGEQQRSDGIWRGEKLADHVKTFRYENCIVAAAAQLGVCQIAEVLQPRVVQATDADRAQCHGALRSQRTGILSTPE